MANDIKPNEELNINAVVHMMTTIAEAQKTVSNVQTERLRLTLEAAEKATPQEKKEFVLWVIVIAAVVGTFVAIIGWAIFHGDREFMFNGLSLITGFVGGAGIGWTAGIKRAEKKARD